MIKVAVIETGPLNVNTYVVKQEQTNDCIVIDPADGESVKNYMDANGLTCKAILLTHGHFDHILGVAYLKKTTSAKVYIHEQDANALLDDKINLGAFSGITVEKCAADICLADKNIIREADMEIKVMHTPGHSMGSVCYIIEEDNVIFSGDTLFYLSVGRADLLYSNKMDLSHSILYKLFALQGKYTVLPGHARATELEFEKENNPFIKLMDYE